MSASRIKIEWMKSMLSRHAGAGALLLTLCVYVWFWTDGNWSMLTDVSRQTDDARTVIFPFHRYGPEGALAYDPIAEEMLSYVPIGAHAIYRALVPMVGLLASTKVVQALCLISMLIAAGWLARRRTIGLAASALLLFLFLRDPFIVGRIAGGLPRGFAFPAIFVWACGAIGQSRNLRWAAALGAALTYPTCMTILLGSEGLLALRGRLHSPTAVGWRAWWEGELSRNLRGYAVLVLMCVVATLPSVASGDGDTVHTYAQAQKEPAFGRDGRLRVLPFGDPLEEAGQALFTPLRFSEHSLVPALTLPLSQDDGLAALLLIVGICALSLTGRIRPPTAGLALLTSSLVLYVAARVLAFQLYSPDRFLEYGVRAAVLVSLTEVIVSARWRMIDRSTAPSLTSLLGILLVWTALGDGIRDLRSMPIRGPGPIDQFAATLPLNVRFASHPDDAQGIPLYAARANMGTKETLQPWLVKSWSRQKERTQDTLRALYAIEYGQVFRYAEQHGVTHFVINQKRYGEAFVERSGSFEPFTAFTKHLLRKRQRSELVFGHIPTSAIVFAHRGQLVVDVSRLRVAIGRQP